MLVAAAQFSIIGLRAAESPPATIQVESFMRVTNAGPQQFELQVAVRKYTSSIHSNSVVWLAAVSHIGETNYYQRLQNHLDAQQLVLFEGILPPGTTNYSGKDLELAKTAARKTDADRSTLQTELADALGLVFQLDAVNYSRPHFRGSDLSVAEIQKLMRSTSKPKSSTTGKKAEQQENESFKQLIEMMQGNSWMGQLVRTGLKLVGANPKFQAIVKLTFVETLGRLKGDITRMQGVPESMRQLLTVLIHSRNQRVLEDLQKELRRENPAKNISVFYGAGHMDDLETRLRKDLSFRPVDQLWLPAFRVDLKQSGVSEFEANLVRMLIDRQMNLLLPTDGADKTKSN